MPHHWLRDPTNGEQYRPTTIVKQILSAAAQIDGGANGPMWWVTDEGMTLTELAGSAPSGGFDWADLHAVFETLPAGRWTTHGDLAEVVDTAAMPLGGHVAACPDCVNAWRILDGSGQSRSGFRWTDLADTRTQHEVLESEGVRFVGDRADAAPRLSKHQLTSAVHGHSE